MPIEFNCHVCGKLLRTSDDKAGRTAKCPGCGENLLVPPASDAAASDEGVADEGEYAGGSGVEDYDEPVAGGTKACPMCGEQVEAAATRCRFCGEELEDGYASAPASWHQPHRGGMILAFGILSLMVCPIFGIVAWVMANGDLQEMKAGRMDPEGEGLTSAGKILSMVSIGLVALGLVGYCFIMIFVVAIGAAG